MNPAVAGMRGTRGLLQGEMTPLEEHYPAPPVVFYHPNDNPEVVEYPDAGFPVYQLYPLS